MRRVVVAGFTLLLALTGAYAQPIEVTDEEALVLRTKTFVGKKVTLKGWMTAADESSATVSFDAGRLGIKSLVFKWPKKDGEFYERGNLMCGSLGRVPACRINISGIVTAYEHFPDSHYLDRAEVQWAK